jgi:Ca2+-transporting ATPase
VDDHRKGDSIKKDNGQTPEAVPLPEEDIDPSPFRFNPWKLASLVDPKSLESLQEMGGVDALIKGLGTDMKNGLSEHALGQDNKVMSETAPSRERALAPSTEDVPYTATLQDRKRVYGENILPARKLKSLLVLMWLAFKDKVLVCDLYFFYVLNHVEAIVGAFIYRCCRLFCSRSFPGFRHTASNSAVW